MGDQIFFESSTIFQYGKETNDRIQKSDWIHIREDKCEKGVLKGDSTLNQYGEAIEKISSLLAELRPNIRPSGECQLRDEVYGLFPATRLGFGRLQIFEAKLSLKV